MSEPGAAKIVRTAAALVVGGELLSGKIRDENSYSLAKTLRALGIDLVHVAIVPDRRERIRDELVRLLAESDAVFTSGGVGPTHDDVTVEGVALALGVDVHEDPKLVEMLGGLYGDRMTPTHRLMARVPRGARLITGDDVRWPLIVADRVWLFPGVPELFRAKLALLRQHVRGPEPFFTEVVLSSSEEADLKPEIDEVVAAHPAIEVGSYPKWFDPAYKTRVTFDGRSRSEVAAAADHFRALLGARALASS